MNFLLPLFIAIPLGSAFLVSLIRSRRFADVFANLSTFALLILSIYAIWLLKLNGVMVYKVGGWVPPFGISLVFDGLSSLLLVTVNLVSFFASLYSINYMEKYTAKEKFYPLFMLMVAGMNGVILTGDMFNLYVFLEIAAVASYALVAFGVESEELEASFKYMVLSSIASAFVLLGIAFLYSYTSSLNMADISSVLQAKGTGHTILFVSVLFLMGFGLKAAIVPFHAWLPDAHPSAPAPISAMLSGVLIKALGVYAILRVFFSVLGIEKSVLTGLAVLGVLSMVIGVFLAIGQWDFKRLLAYHSISQIGYVILGIGLGTPLGIMGGLFHLFNHSVFKSLLFLNSGAVVYSTGTRDLQKMGGLREEMPVTGSTSMIASMSIAGIPPFNGFWSKLIIIIACVQAGHMVYAILAVIVSLLTLASFMKVQRYAFFGEKNDRSRSVKEVPFFMKTSMMLLSVVCLLGGILLIPVLKDYLLDPAQNVLASGTDYARTVMEILK
jgi:multicomponent Na+:H+ antiporter subunit D